MSSPLNSLTYIYNYIYIIIYIYIRLYFDDDIYIYICVCPLSLPLREREIYIYISVLKAAVSKILSHVDCVCVCQKAEAQVATAIRSMKCVATVCRNGLWIMWSTRPLRTDLQIAWSGGISQDETTVES